MKIEFDIENESFKEAVIKEIAHQIITKEDDPKFITFWGDLNVRQELREKAVNLLKSDKKLAKEIKEEVKMQMKDKRLIREIAKNAIEEKMRDYDD